MRFFIISPSFKADKFLKFHVGSVQGQINKNFNHILILDGSVKEDIESVSNFLDIPNLTIIKPNFVGGPMSSHLLGIEKAKELGIQDDDVIVHLDGDDWFFHPLVTQILEDIYKSTGCWATYGEYISTDGTPSICKPSPHKPNRSKLNDWYFSHLRTFKYFLFKQIKESDFKDDNGDLFKMAADVAIITPILEMCPLSKIKYINYPNVVYNRFSKFNEDKVNASLQRSTGEVLKFRSPYKELKV